jgi:hypothetical protein
MIANIAAILGPLDGAHLDLDPAGVSHVHGPTAAGKSTLIDVVTGVIDGRDRHGDVIGASHLAHGVGAAMSFTLSSGTTFSRTVTAGGTTKRTAAKADGTKTTHTSNADFATRLGRLGDGDLVRTIVAPAYWLDLAASTDGRKLRDLLERVLPGPNAAEWLAPQLREGEPDTEKRAVEARRHANAELDAAKGAHAALVGQLDGLTRADEPAADVDLPELDRGIAELEAHQKAHTEAAATHRRWAAARDLFDRSARQVVEAPRSARPTAEQVEASNAGSAACREEVVQREARVRSAKDALKVAMVEPSRAEIDRIDGLINAAERAAGQLRAVPCGGQTLHSAGSAGEDLVDLHPVDCSTCPLIGAAQKARDELPALGERLTNAESKFHAEVERSTELRAAAQRELTVAEGLLAAAQDAARRASETQVAVSALARAWQAHDQAAGGRPAHPGDEPAVLEDRSRDLGMLRQARDRAIAARASAAQNAQRREKLTADIGKAAARVAAADAAATRADEVVALCRAAPGAALRGKLEALADLGPVSVELSGESDALSVLIDGLPWRRASTGRTVVASVCFRDALRRAVGLAKLPLFVDEAQSVGGCLLPTPAPCIVLWTGAGVGLEVRAVGGVA